MTKNERPLKLVAGNANPEFAASVAEAARVPLTGTTVKRFSDGEIQVRIEENVRGYDVFVIQPTCTPVNENLVELLILLDTLRRASARRITAVMPYFGYARQDRKTRGREPITARLVANLITTAGAARVLTMDLHADQLQGFFDIPVDHLTAMHTLASHFAGLGLTDPIVVADDVGSVARARRFARQLNLPLAIVDKDRLSPGVASVETIIGPDISGRDCILVADMIDTAGTVCQGAVALMDRGAAGVYAMATHPVFSGPAEARLREAPFKEVVVTDTIPTRIDLPNLTVCSVAPLMAEAIVRIHEDRSVSKLFR